MHLSPGQGFCNMKRRSLELNWFHTEASVLRYRYFQQWKVKNGILKYVPVILKYVLSQQLSQVLVLKPDRSQPLVLIDPSLWYSFK